MALTNTDTLEYLYSMCQAPPSPSVLTLQRPLTFDFKFAGHPRVASFLCTNTVAGATGRKPDMARISGANYYNLKFRLSAKPRQLFAEATVPLQVPFAAHGFTAGPIFFGIKERPGPPARGARALAAVVPVEARIQIDRPTHIGAPAIAAKHIDKTVIHDPMILKII